ncbi:TPA: chorismate--pyruvate lyase family protein [Photobacterium damselae]
MSDFKQLYNPLLEKAQWQVPELAQLIGSQLAPWLLETESLSQRLAQCCQHFTVTVLEQVMVEKQQLSIEEKELVGDIDCLSRKVILNGDGVPWVFARTLIPLSTLTGDEQDLAQLGEKPLGYRVFTADNARRDALVIANICGETSPLWARRSRLWLNDKPLLVAELFLESAPIYAKDSEC